VTDSRDRVFGLLGLQTTDNDPANKNLIITPDYTISATEIFHKLGMTIIERSNSLRLLSSVQHDGAIIKSRPSWVPQWDTVQTSTISPWDLDQGFAAAKDFSLERKGTVGVSGRLTVRGLEVTTIAEALPLMREGLDHSVLFNPAVKSFFQTLPGLILLSKTLTSGRSWYGTLANDSTSGLADFAAYLLQFVKSGDGSVNTNQSSDPKHQIQQLVGEGIMSSKMVDIHELSRDGDAARFSQAALAVCNGRRLFITSSGSLGLGPSCLTVGDTTWVLSGGELPFILRLENDDHYLVVGECFVDGQMQGEVVEAASNSTPLGGNIKAGSSAVAREMKVPKSGWVEIW
jgi:hypothetical protein